MQEQELYAIYTKFRARETLSLDELDHASLIVTLCDKVSSHSPEHLNIMAHTMGLDISGLDNVRAACRILANKGA